LLLKIEHVKDDSSSLKVHLQKIGLKNKIEQELGSKINLQNIESKLKVEHVQNGSTSKIQIETIYSNVQKIFGLPIDPTIHSLKCCIKEI
jgi:hypothetical protein